MKTSRPVQTDCREQQRACRKSSKYRRAEASWSNHLANAIGHGGDGFNGELPIDASDLGADGRCEGARIGVGANGQLELPSKCGRSVDVVQYAIGKLAEGLVRVNGRRGSERAIGDVGDDADHGEPGVLVLRDVEPPAQALADGILSRPEGPRQPLVDDDDAARLDGFDLRKHPAALQPDAERLEIGAIDPRKIRVGRSPIRQFHPFGREHAILVSLERQIRHQRRRAHPRQSRCAREEGALEAADAGRGAVASARKRERRGQYAIGIESGIRRHERGEAPDEESGPHQEDAGEHDRGHDEASLYAVPSRSRCRTRSLLKGEPGASASDAAQRDRRKEEGRRDGNAGGECQHANIDRELSPGGDCCRSRPWARRRR